MLLVREQAEVSNCGFQWAGLVLCLPSAGSTEKKPNEHAIAVGNFNGKATLKVIQRDSSTEVLSISEPSNLMISEYCSNGNGMTCRKLLVVSNTTMSQYIALVSLENGIWMADLRYNGSEMSYNAMHSLMYREPCRTLGIFDILGGIYTLCTRRNILYICGLRIMSDNITASFRECGSDPSRLGTLDLLRGLPISNIIIDGDTFDQTHLRFFVGKTLYSVRVIRNRLFLSMMNLQECDYVTFLKKQRSIIYIYCNNSHVYSHTLNTDDSPVLLGHGGLYYPCLERYYFLDRSKEHLFYGNLSSIGLSSSDYNSGVCFGEDKFVYNDRVGTYVIFGSQNNGRLEVTDLNTPGCRSTHCNAIMVFLDRYILISDNQSITVIDSSGRNKKIIQANNVPTSLVTVIALYSPVNPTTAPPETPSKSVAIGVGVSIPLVLIIIIAAILVPTIIITW